jgi:uncharacterized protein (TIGR02466 family)
MLENISLPQQTAPTSILTPYNHFVSTIYIIDKPEFLDPVRKVSTKYLDSIKKNGPEMHPMFPVHQTDGIAHEPALADFTNFIAQSAWAILNDQGFTMNNSSTYIQEMWCQEHHKYSGHDEHTHNHSAQISGFYFLDCPADSCMLTLHDPRPAKNQINLHEQDAAQITYASAKANYQPKPGQMYFINSWLPHGLTRNASKSPMRMVHFNVGVNVGAVTPQTQTTANTPAPPAATVI